MLPDTSAVVLAGGMSRRLGHDKRQLRLWGAQGPTLLERVVEVVGHVCTEVLVVLNDPQHWPQLPARLLPDRYPAAGPLGGIATGLEAVQYPYALVVACDMPLLNSELLRAMLARPRDYDGLVPRSFDPSAVRNTLGLEPFHAIYSKACCAAIQTALAAGRRDAVAFFHAVRIVAIEPHESLRFDPAGRSFWNINTAEQLDIIAAAINTDRSCY